MFLLDKITKKLYRPSVLPVESKAQLKASDGTLLSLDDLAQSLSYNADGTLNYTQVTAPEGTYRQSFTYAAGKLTNISAWVKQ